ncbi:pyridoxamine 5'-phosphate oxidase family protein [Tomitella fengzijianii]|uniref:Pyridoxamine 5'-phosphate oxidase family protein n=2 Tax=Tomitella fengzijianii TaxID=2597660 RepID=A0A516X7N0_9ACTN|nr:pyridoxamine 5'-phosphate oxidase family protein [Tomitella fengzijianii]
MNGDGTDSATAGPGEAAGRQRRGRAIAMGDAERDAFLAAERTCRVATVGADGAPHVSPLWFGWSDGALWLFSITKSRRWRDLESDPRVSVVVDAGEQYDELRGVEISGHARQVGEVPRTAAPDPELEAVEQQFADKYMGGTFYADGRHAWLRIVPEKIVSWDFRKLAALQKG